MEPKDLYNKTIIRTETELDRDTENHYSYSEVHYLKKFWFSDGSCLVLKERVMAEYLPPQGGTDE